jgi:excisionase family DNA binding protein
MDETQAPKPPPIVHVHYHYHYDRRRKRQTQQQPQPQQPPTYLNAEEAASYLRKTVKAMYGLVERGRLKPLPGSRRYRFTREQLDEFLRGRKQ